MTYEKQSEMQCILQYFAGGKIFISNLDPILKHPTDLYHNGIDVAIGCLEEQTQLRHLRMALPGYIRHHHFCIYPADKLSQTWNTIARLIIQGMEARLSVLIYSRSLEIISSILIAFLIRAQKLRPEYLFYDFLNPIEKTHENWTLSFIRFLQRRCNEELDVTATQFTELRAYEYFFETY